MPDWSYHPLKKLLLNRMKAKASREFIHRSMSVIASLPFGRHLIEFLGHMEPPKDVSVHLNQTDFPSIVGLSGTIDPNLSGIRAFQELGFGFLEIGPIVLKEMKVKNEPLWKNNRIMFPKNGEKLSLKHALRILTHLPIRIPVIARIDHQVDKNEWNLIVEHLAPFVDAFVCSYEQFQSYAHSPSCRPVYVSFSADEVHVVEHLPANGVVIDAPQQMEDSFYFEAGNAYEQLCEAVKYINNKNPKITIIASGGVRTPEEGFSLVQAGAHLLLLTEGYVKAGPGLPKRIHERLQYEKRKTFQSLPWHWSLLFGLAILIGGIIAMYFAFTSVILSYDESFIGMTRTVLMEANPLILAFMAHDRMALAGTMISGGILYIQLARHGIKNNLHWAKIAYHTAAIIGFFGIFLFIGYGYFDWLHGLFWLILLPIYYFSFREGTKVTGATFSSHGTNDKYWKRSLYGQLMFVILGFSILIGGIVISIIGVSKVFISTDLQYLCMTPQMLEDISRNLIPVIAHDRAGFGGALVSVGLLVLMISLWGFRQGDKWIWNTLAVGALPAFIAGIGTHIYIGYTTFIHLLPVYFLLVLYILGLILSYPYLKKVVGR